MANNTPSPFTNQRLFDLVRQQRMELHNADLISDEEYLELAHEHSAVARLEDYDAMRERIRTLEAERDAAESALSVYQLLFTKAELHERIAKFNGPLPDTFDAARKGATEE